MAKGSLMDGCSREGGEGEIIYTIFQNNDIC